MSYNTKNYTEQGGEKTVIGGTLEFEEEAIVTGLPPLQLEAATDTLLGGIKAELKAAGDTVLVKIGEDEKLYVPTYPSVVIPVADTQVESTAATLEGLVTDFNSLLAKLKAVGLMTIDTP